MPVCVCVYDLNLYNGLICLYLYLLHLITMLLSSLEQFITACPGVTLITLGVCW